MVSLTGPQKVCSASGTGGYQQRAPRWDHKYLKEKNDIRSVF